MEAITPEAAQALMSLTAKTPRFTDQRITQTGKDEETNTVYYVVTAHLEGSNVVFSVNIGLTEEVLSNSMFWDRIVDAVADELNKIQITQ